jgi:hypothetical protein
MRFRWILILLALVVGAESQLSQAGSPQKVDLLPDVHPNHVRKTSAEYISAFRRITWYYDFASATKLARETGRPMFVLFCRAGTITDPVSGKLRCSS